ncbi:dinb protein [hydrocarbon metagenome]|uniref:Dinb protein n=1 Tax=hydrocarbon metagenome TaxID=938273 RepID=A0A0W8FZH8_9ZZZZ
MTKEYFISLLEYDTWANKRIAEVLTGKVNLPPKCKTLFHHIGATIDLWYVRVTGEERFFQNLFDETSPQKTAELVNKGLDRWNDLLNDDKTDLDTIVSYINSQGEHFNSKLADILTHLFSHNHYHRGQINQTLRHSGFEPARVDYIVYVRE